MEHLHFIILVAVFVVAFAVLKLTDISKLPWFSKLLHAEEAFVKSAMDQAENLKLEAKLRKSQSMLFLAAGIFFCFDVPANRKSNSFTNGYSFHNQLHCSSRCECKIENATACQEAAGEGGKRIKKPT